MDTKSMMKVVSEMIEQCAGEDHEHTEMEKSAIVCDLFASLAAIAALTHADLSGQTPKQVFETMTDHIEEAIAAMILEEACQSE